MVKQLVHRAMIFKENIEKTLPDDEEITMYPYDQIYHILCEAESPIMAIVEMMLHFGGSTVYFPQDMNDRQTRYSIIRKLLSKGLSYKTIAARLRISEKTIQRASRDGVDNFG